MPASFTSSTTLTFAVLLACFGLQIHDCLFKFLARKSLSTQSVSYEDSVRLPKLTFCPGYNKDELRESRPDEWRSFFQKNMSYFTLHEDAGEAAVEDVMEWWKNVTYGPEEVFLEFRNHGVYVEAGPFSSENETHRFDGDRIVVEERSGMFGRCYTLTWDQGMAVDGICAVAFLRPHSHDCYGLFIHSGTRGELLGLQRNMWPEDIHYLYLRQNVSYTIAFTKTRRVKMESERCDADATQETYNGCILDWLKGRYRLMDCDEVCWTPQTRQLVQDVVPPIPPCLTAASTACVDREFRDVALPDTLKDGVTGCCRPCRTDLYDVNIEEDMFFESDRISAYFDLQSNDVVVVEESLVFDFNDIVTAVGGSLGLFLGFSCLQAATAAIDAAKKYSDCCRRAKK